MSLQAQGNTDPGRLDRRVTLQAPYQDRDENGASIPTWVNIADVWAAKSDQTGQRTFAAEDKQAIETVAFRIRHRLDVQNYWRLVNGNNVFEIIPPLEELGRRHFLNLTCRAVNQKTGSGLDVLLLEGSSGSSFLELEDGTPLILEAA